jgi:DNA-binding NarL/FixJ family response regulator
MPPRARVAVWASRQLTGLGLSNYLESQPAIAVLPASQAAAADVLVVGTDSLDDHLGKALGRLAAGSPTRTVLVTGRVDGSVLATAASCRVVEILPPLTTCEALVRAVWAAAEWSDGASRLDLAAELRARYGRNEAGAHGATALRSREVDVLRLVADGLETAEIAQRLCYSERTVTNVLGTLRRRLRLNNRSHIVAYALRAGLI